MGNCAKVYGERRNGNKIFKEEKRMERKLMEFIIKEAGSKKERTHLVMYGDFIIETQTIYEEMNIPVFNDVVVKKVMNGKELDWEAKTVSFSGYELTGADCAGYALAAMISSNCNMEIVYLDAAINMIIKQYTGKTAFEFNGRQIPEYYYSPTYGTSKLYFATDKFLYYDDFGATTMINTKYGYTVADGDLAETGLFDSFKAVSEGKEKLLYGKIPEEYTDYC